MDKKVRIVLAEDHTILREGLRALLSADAKFEIVGEAADGRQAVRAVEKLGPDLVMMDLSMPADGSQNRRISADDVAGRSRCLCLKGCHSRRAFNGH
jgi:DNA-binding NarL/FixJ family response regulator